MKVNSEMVGWAKYDAIRPNTWDNEVEAPQYPVGATLIKFALYSSMIYIIEKYIFNR